MYVCNCCCRVVTTRTSPTLPCVLVLPSSFATVSRCYLQVILALNQFLPSPLKLHSSAYWMLSPCMFLPEQHINGVMVWGILQCSSRLPLKCCKTFAAEQLMVISSHRKCQK